MDLGRTALGNWKAQQGGCTHIQVRTSIRRNSTRVLRVSQRGRIPFPPPLCSSSTRSMTSSELFFFLFVGPRTFLLTHLFLPPHPQPQPHLCGFSASAFDRPNKSPKGVRIAGWNSPNTTSDKTFLWRCAVSPHKKKRNAHFQPPTPTLSHSAGRS
jgi:hypothetical protein